MKVFVECYTDEVLAQVLVGSKERKKITHVFSKGNVFNELSKATYSVGIADEDPGSGKPAYEKKMRKVIEDTLFILCLDKKSGNKAVILRPYLEEFICKLAKKNGIDLKDYKLPDKPNELHDRLMSGKNNKNLDYLHQFLSKILNPKGELHTIKKLIQKS